MILGPIQLQLGALDTFLSVLGNLRELLILSTILSGYVFFSLSSRSRRPSSLWQGISGNERTLIGASISSSFAFVTYWSVIVTFSSLDIDFGSLDPIVVALFLTIIALLIVPVILRTYGSSKAGVRRTLLTASKWLSYLYLEGVLFALFLGSFVAVFYDSQLKWGIVGVSYYDFLWLGVVWFLWALFCKTYSDFFHHRDFQGDESDVYTKRKLFSPEKRIYRFGSYLGRNRFLTVATTALLVCLILVGLDLQFAVFTPKEFHQTIDFYQDPTNPVGYLMDITAIYSLGYRNVSSSPCAIKFYQPLQTNETITIPWSSYKATENVTINADAAGTLFASYFSEFTAPGQYPWAFVTAHNLGDSNISIDKSGNFRVGFPNAPRRSILTLSLEYYRISQPNITCLESLSASKLSNGTWVISHDFSFHSDANSTAIISLFRIGDIVGHNLQQPSSEVSVSVNEKTINFQIDQQGELTLPTNFDSLAPSSKEIVNINLTVQT